MEGRFQAKGAEGDGSGGGEITMNNKRTTMTLNVNGLWDVVPRLDHYRCVYILITGPILLFRPYRSRYWFFRLAG